MLTSRLPSLSMRNFHVLDAILLLSTLFPERPGAEIRRRSGGKYSTARNRNREKFEFP